MAYFCVKMTTKIKEDQRLEAIEASLQHLSDDEDEIKIIEDKEIQILTQNEDPDIKIVAQVSNNADDEIQVIEEENEEMKLALALSLDPGEQVQVAKPRPVVIDGCNVGFCHGKNQHFSAQGIRIIYDYFKDLGYEDENIIVIVKHIPERYD